MVGGVGGAKLPPQLRREGLQEPFLTTFLTV